ncbi:MAG TPA: gluconate 2-dehydrogenase subunit 3 family protein [Chitinophagaceae bacterium]|nr:gluconate 2-dehydrogenase subunit 3 family protein [Chitinophagaceae bacterium]
MDRRKSLKLIATGAVAAPAVIAGCKTGDEKPKTEETSGEPKFNLDRNPDEVKYEKEVLAKGKFFTDHEMATITILADIIIPRDEVSGSASDAKVPDFIEFIVKDMPQHQVPMRGGLRWLDMQCLKRFEKSFKDCSETEQLKIVDEIAYPEISYKDKNGNPVKKGIVGPGMQPGVNFFNLMRNLTATGFYTSEIGVKDIGYEGNKATRWNGVPDEVLKQQNVAYTEKELKECV